MLQSKSIDEYIPENFQLVTNSTGSLHYPHVGSSDRLLFSCSQCHSNLFDNTNPTSYIQENRNRQLLNDLIVIKEINCSMCTSFVGFRIVSFMPSEADLTPPPLYTVNEVRGLNQFKHYLEEIENNLNARFERQNHSKFIDRNQEYIGKYYICLSNVLITSYYGDL
ncbi:hypothetical protein Cantr_05996 [Candida viswanathii]|uniref:Protein yippee-like n=1 Tax=Candida viswanathii TaxID=5486 RepID=A0A367XSE4_9ASCO|nr:hypothetical protein Cantr_05996 [Candida viswanathii]